MKKFIAALAGLVALTLGAVSLQTTKQITLGWDAMPAGEIWQQVRIYDVSQTPELLLATAPCSPGPTIVCPTEVTFAIQKRAHQFAARSWDGFWESDNSNVVILPGPPKPPVNVKK